MLSTGEMHTRSLNLLLILFANYILDNKDLGYDVGRALNDFEINALNSKPPPANFNRGWNET